MTSESVYSNITQLQTFTADGVSNEFTTEYPIGIIESAFLNDEYLDIATTGEREMGITADLYYTPKENVITLEE